MVKNFEKQEDVSEQLSKYLKKIANYRILDRKQERLLIKAAAAGDFEAKKELILCNLRLVTAIARKHIHKSNIPFTDLIQEGTTGLIYAIGKFNPEYKCKFATYASWWIKQAMFRAIAEQSFCVKIPVYIQETLSKYNKAKQRLENSSGISVSSTKVAQELNISEKKIDDYLNAYTQSLSLDAQIELANGGNMQLGEMLADNSEDICAKLEHDELRQAFCDMLLTLKGIEPNVIVWRFGLNNEPRKTLEEIGKFYGVTKECIRQTELRAIKKMGIEARKRALVCNN